MLFEVTWSLFTSLLTWLGYIYTLQSVTAVIYYFTSASMVVHYQYIVQGNIWFCGSFRLSCLTSHQFPVDHFLDHTKGKSLKSLNKVFYNLFQLFSDRLIDPTLQCFLNNLTKKYFCLLTVFLEHFSDNTSIECCKSW